MWTSPHARPSSAGDGSGRKAWRRLARCEMALTEFELEPDEELSVAAHLQYGRKARERVEKMLAAS